MICGNVTAKIQQKTSTQKNEIGEDIIVWSDIKEITGFIDLMSGESKHTVYSAKVQESTHIFICDYTDLSGINAEKSRLICNSRTYEILLIDNPMELNKQLEIYLKYVGGQ